MSCIAYSGLTPPSYYSCWAHNNAALENGLFTAFSRAVFNLSLQSEFVCLVCFKEIIVFIFVGEQKKGMNSFNDIIFK
jgi:hypothetical protein